MSEVVHAVSYSEYCERRDLNPHAFRHRNLNPARLPIPPLSRYGYLTKLSRRTQGGLAASHQFLEYCDLGLTHKANERTIFLSHRLFREMKTDIVVQ